MAEWRVCRRCGEKGSPKKRVKGSMLVEIVLWLFFLVPGLIYSIWRLSTKAQVCPYCGSEELVPVDSPVGRSLLEAE